MRFHVLGVGSVGTLICHHLKRALRLRQQGFRLAPQLDPIPNEVTAALHPDPHSVEITLHLRSSRRAEQFRATTVEVDGLATEEGGYRIELAGTGQVDAKKSPPQVPSAIASPALDPRGDLIDSLIVTTKADATIDAIEPLASRICPASTIVLLQNGTGIVDELISRLFPVPRLRPHIILGNLSHGVWSKGRFNTVHAGFGQLDLGLLPDPRGKIDYEQKRLGLDPRTHRLLSGLDLGAIPSTFESISLRYTLATLLSLPLDVHWNRLQSYQLKALRKLAVNACINPLTAILDCKNGKLMGDVYAQQIWSNVCHEAAEVFLAAATDGEASTAEDDYQLRPHYNLNPNSPDRRGALPPSMTPWSHLTHPPLDDSKRPPLDESLTPASLFAATKTIASVTTQNFSSMHADVRGSRTSKKPRGRTEIDFLNGYLVKKGKEYGVDVKTNELLCGLVKSLCQENKRGGTGRR